MKFDGSLQGTLILEADKQVHVKHRHTAVRIRERRAMERRIRLTRFPVTKSLDTFDFMAMPSLNKSLALELARCEWIDKRENVIALGPSGVSKTHTALALKLAAC